MMFEFSISFIDDDASWHQIATDLFSGGRLRHLSCYSGVSSFKSALAVSSPPDLAIIDIFLKKPNEGFRLLEWIKHIDMKMKCIVFTGRSKDVLKAMALGAEGFLTKAEANLLVEAAETVLQGRRYLSRQGWDYIVRQFNEYGSLFQDLFKANLTQKEKEVIRAYLQAKSRKGVSTWTGLKENTIKKHNTSILKKLSLRRMHQVAGKFGRFF